MKKAEKTTEKTTNRLKVSDGKKYFMQMEKTSKQG